MGREWSQLARLLTNLNPKAVVGLTSVRIAGQSSASAHRAFV